MSDYYWFHFDTFMNERGRAEYNFTDGTSNLSSNLIRKIINDTNNDVLSCDSLFFMTNWSYIDASTTTDLHVPAESLHSMKFFSFHVKSDFIFSFYNNIQCTQKLSKRVVFCEVIVDVGCVRDKNKSAFIVSVSGI